jgi:hypothetical protein
VRKVAFEDAVTAAHWGSASMATRTFEDKKEPFPSATWERGFKLHPLRALLSAHPD